jgi:electron transport complex protein RnfG
VAASEAGPLRLMATLGVAGLCSGLALAGIYLITLPMIERNRAEALETAIYKVLPGASSRVAFVVRDGSLTQFEEAGIPKEDAVFIGYDENGTPLGFAIPAQGPGFQDTIKLLYGYHPGRRRVVGMEILESKETPGLGDKIFKDMKFVGAFGDLAVDPELVVTKKGATQPNELDAISGATISSKAVARIINLANVRWLERLPEMKAIAPTETTAGAGEGE